MKIRLYGGRNDGAEFKQSFPPDGIPTENLIMPWLGFTHQGYRLREIRQGKELVAIYDFVGPCDIWGNVEKATK